MSKPIVIFSTCANIETAQKVASRLVDERLAACVTIIDGVRSTYRWQGSINVDSEAMMVIKTTSGRAEQVRAVVTELSGCELPEFVALEIVGGSQSYLDWLEAETGG
jgi:periplasmic divalent cation tolerance protein